MGAGLVFTTTSSACGKEPLCALGRVNPPVPIPQLRGGR